MNLSRQKLMLIRERLALAVILIALGFLVNSYVYGPFDKKVDGLKAEIARLRSEASQYRALSASVDDSMKRLESAKGELRALEAELSSSGRLLPTVGEASSILNEITKAQPGLSFVYIKPSPIEDRDSYSVLPVVLQLRGSFPSLGGYISKMDASERVINARKISIEKDATEGLLMNLNLEILLMRELVF